MSIPIRQNLRIGQYLLGQKLARRAKYPLIVELEPLFACNLHCKGCGKSSFPGSVLSERMSPEEALAAMQECGAPMVSIAGGEPLLHPRIGELVDLLIEHKYFVYLCSNGLLLREKLELFRPSSRFAWVVHVDGLEQRHDESVGREGTFRESVAAIREAKRRGFRVTTNSTFFSTDSPDEVVGLLDFLGQDLGVDAMMLSPAHAQESARDAEHFLQRQQARELFRSAFGGGRRRHWRLNHSPVFLDFLEGRIDLPCTPWAIPSYSVLGWQRPCYLLADGYASTYRGTLGVDRLGTLRRGQGPTLCELPGPQWVRAIGGPCHHEFAPIASEGRFRPVLTRLRG